GYLVRTTGDLENTDVLDSANDPFGDMFSEPGLSEIDLPVRQRPPIATDSMVMRSKQADNGSGQPASGQSASAGSQKEEGQTPVSPQSASTSDTASATKAAIQKLSTPLAPVDVDGELQVPENIETPEGFYGDLSGVAPAMPSLEKVAVADAPKPVSTPTEKDKASPAEDDVPELVGERLTRSHTVHTRLLTVPGIATMVLVALLGITTVAWAQRALRTPRREPVPETLGELGLPAQIEVSLNQNDLDAAAVATKALIDQGDYLQAIAALETADRRQQEDVIVSFFRGRAQWGLAKQGRDNFSADDAMRSWMTALDSESDWMEITMALGFAHYAVGREQLALEAWERAIDLAQRQLDAKGAYFSDQSFGEYVLNAHAGVAMSALSLSKIEADPAVRNQLLEQASIAYRRVISEAPSEFNASALGNNWLWLGGAIADWEEAKEELSQTVEIE
ncbi:MAG: tetratricopeptide repeat protein, partial [Cyanobacteria bacterium J06607_13]